MIGQSVGAPFGCNSLAAVIAAVCAVAVSCGGASGSGDANHSGARVAPRITGSLTPHCVPTGTTTTVSWSSSNADGCQVDANLDGIVNPSSMPLSGSVTSAAMPSNT